MSTSDSKIKCESCGREAQNNFAKCLRDGWPECCGTTMMLISTQADIDQAVGGPACPEAGDQPQLVMDHPRRRGGRALGRPDRSCAMAVRPRGSGRYPTSG